MRWLLRGSAPTEAAESAKARTWMEHAHTGHLHPIMPMPFFGHDWHLLRVHPTGWTLSTANTVERFASGCRGEDAEARAQQHEEGSSVQTPPSCGS